MVDVVSPMTSVQVIRFYSDASAAERLGYRCVFNSHWLFGQWEEQFINKCEPSIEYLELFALCTGVLTWAEDLTNCRVVIHCDNQAVVHMVNKLSSTCANCMYLLRILVLNCMKYNRKIFMQYVDTKSNFLADALSRLKISQFKRLAPAGMDEFPSKIHDCLWPVSKIWQKKN